MSECVVRIPKHRIEEMREIGCGGCPIKFQNCLLKEDVGDTCPILAVLPEKHGELIDRQAVYEKIKWWQENTHDTVTKAMLHEFYLMLYGVPAIVPADGESPSPKPTDPLPIRGVEYVPTEVDVKTGTVTYELRERSEKDGR